MHGPATKEEQLAQQRKIASRLSKVRYPVMVMSGKGGVGKSTVAVNLAKALARAGHKVGIMDVDLHGPNVPLMLGIEGQTFETDGETIQPVPVEGGIVAASIALAGYGADEAIIWRGPVKIGLIRQFLADVDWGELDYLIFDTPPGTGDESLTLAQTVHTMAGAVVVTTPQDVSLLDTRKSLDFAGKLKVPVLGIIENMSGFVCPCCGTRTPIFGEGGGKRLAETVGAPFLGALPIDPAVVSAGDGGKPFLGQSGAGSASEVFGKAVETIQAEIIRLEAERARKRDSEGGFRPER